MSYENVTLQSFGALLGWSIFFLLVTEITFSNLVAKCQHLYHHACSLRQN